MVTDIADLILRLVLGGMFVYEGKNKLFRDVAAPRGRGGLAKLIAAKGFPAPGLMAYLVSLSQFAGGAMLLLGLLTRLALLPLAATVGMAAFVFKWRAGFTNGWDWPFVVFGACVALLLLGSGSYSLDALLGIPFTSAN